MTPPLDLDALEALANAATLGPWYAHQPAGVNWHIWNDDDVFVLEQRNRCAPVRNRYDAAYIAALHQQAALALIARVRALEQENARLTVQREWWKESHDAHCAMTCDCAIKEPA